MSTFSTIWGLAVEPFTIVCSTCQSRIRVNNEKLIGQVANCPKCGSMMMISAPQPQVTVDSPQGNVDSMAMTKDGIASDLLNSPDQLPSETTDSFRLSPLEESDYSPAEQTPVSWEPDQPLLPSDDWASESSTKTKQYLLLGFLGGGGIALAVLGFLLFLNWYGKSDSPEGLANAGTLSTSQTGDGPGAADRDSDSELTRSDEGEKAPAVGSAGPGANDLQGDGNVDPKSDTPEDSVSAGTNVPGAMPSDQPKEPDRLGANDDGAEQFEVNDPFDTEASLSAAEEEKANTKKNLPASLAEWAPLLDIVVVASVPESGVPIGPPPITAEDLGLVSSMGRDPLPDIDWEERKATSLPGFLLSGKQSLAQTVNTWTHLSGMPTWVNLDSFAAANLSTDQSVTVPKLQNTTLAEVASKIAEAAKAEWVSKAGFLELRATQEAIDSRSPATIDLSGVTESEEQAAAAAQNLARLFPGSQGAWKLEGFQLQRSDALDQITWFRAARLIENLRAAAGEDLRLGQFAPSLLTVPFLQAQRLTYLDNRLQTFSFQSSPIGQAITEACGEVGVEVWFDWPNLTKIGVGPSTTGVVLTQGRTLRQVLRTFAIKYELEFAILDERKLWVTSRRGYRESAQVFVLKSQGKTAEQWEQQLEDFVSLSPDGVATLVVLQAFDGEHIIARCCWPRLKF